MLAENHHTGVPGPKRLIFKSLKFFVLDLGAKFANWSCLKDAIEHMKLRKLLSGVVLMSSLGILPTFAQDPNPPSPIRSNGWKKFDPSTAQQAPDQDPSMPPQSTSQAPPPQNGSRYPSYPQQ